MHSQNFVRQSEVMQQMNQELEKNSQSAQVQLNIQQLTCDTLTTNYNEAQQCYLAWKERCELLEVHLSDTRLRLLQYREWHDANKDVVKYGKKGI